MGFPEVLVGIAGGSGSGKSTLARAVLSALGESRASIISFDDYYRDLAHEAPEVRARVNFDHPDSLDHALFARHLGELRAGRAVEVPVYDFATHSRTGRTSRVEPRPIVIAEGILLLAVESVAAMLDFGVFVEAAEPLRLGRRLARDVQERLRSEASVLAQFAATVRPMHERFVEPSGARADLRISGAASVDVAVRQVLAALDKAFDTGIQDP